MVYNIPLSLLAAYRGQELIVRCQQPRELVASLSSEDLARLSYVQLLCLPAEVEPLLQWEESVPIDVVLDNPDRDFPLLYRYSPLLDVHSVRVSLPVVPGFSKAVKLATALNFAVKLEVTQPGPGLIEEMAQVVHSYLHHSTVSQPIEYFHSLFLAVYHEEATSLWAIQEEDPASCRYITDQGEESISQRLAGMQGQGDIGSAVERFTQALLAEQGECCGCEFFASCGGYFKWPDRTFGCDGVKTLFRTVWDAAEEFTHDLATFATSRGGQPS